MIQSGLSIVLNIIQIFHYPPVERRLEQTKQT